MLFLKLNKIKPGMILGKTLMSSSGHVLLHAGVELRPTYIEKIAKYGFPGIYIENEFTKDIEIKDAIPEALRHKTAESVKKMFKTVEAGKMKTVSSSFEHLKKSVYDIIDAILESKGTITNIVDLKNHDEYTFQHSVNVTVISVILGSVLGYGRDELFILGMAALFHDIGKTRTPLEILNKPEKLTAEEFDEMKKHSRHGYDYIKAHLDLPAVVYVSVLEHHEKYNGEGYPECLSGEGILQQARIIAVADVYDAVTSNRPYSAPMEPANAFDLIVSGSSVHFDPEIVSVFTHTIAPYPAGSVVLLSDGRFGVVAENYEDCILRPLIKIIPKNRGNGDNEYVDLKNDADARNVTITGTA